MKELSVKGKGEEMSGSVKSDALKIMDTLHRYGYDAYIVGGAVRDRLLNQPVHDVDVASSASPEQIMGIFPASVDAGMQNGTVLIPSGKGTVTEVSTFKSLPGSRKNCILEDLALRDFTVNAMAETKEGTILDPFNGRADLDNRILRAVGDPEQRLKEDPLRVLRAIRFAVKYSFTIHADLEQAIRKYAFQLAVTAFERKGAELEKMLGSALCERDLIYFLNSPPAAHLEPLFTDRQVWLKKLQQSPAPFLTEGKAMFWFIAAGINDPEVSSRRLSKAKRSSRLKKQVSVMQEVLSSIISDGWTNVNLYKAGEELAMPCERIRALWRGEEPQTEAVLLRYHELPIKSKKDLAVNGRLLIDTFAISDGKWIGKTLKQIEKAVVRSELPNEESTLLDYIRKEVPK
ncbi:CCA tRNA nucleotidyltransferase [Alteribacter lacisalsi]|nr:CCA tRNA nucleotidyltransferase [Alteribacter lacisalsi]